MPINQPSNQIKFTNVSVVKLKKGVYKRPRCRTWNSGLTDASLGKKRFELACYKNKLLEYRSGAETDLDNVLQVPTIFLSVQKAQTAPSAELAKSFGPDIPLDEIREEILRKGEMQVGERERKEMFDRTEKEVVDIVSGRLIDPSSKRVYPPGIISKALDQLSSASGHLQQSQNNEAGADGGAPSQPRKPIWSGVAPNKPAKGQALEAMKALIAWQPIPVMRARMRLRITSPVTLLKQSVKTGAPQASGSNAEKEAAPSNNTKSNKKGGKKSKARQQQDSDNEAGGSDKEAPTKTSSTLKDKILSYIESVETQDVVGDELEVVGFALPGAFKFLNEFVGNETRGQGRVEVLDMAVTHED